MSQTRADHLENGTIHILRSDSFVPTSDEGHENVNLKASKTTDVDQSLMHQFHRASQLANEIFVKELNDLDLTPRQFVVLAALASNDGSSQTKIVKLTGIDRSTIADIIRRMVKSGLLERRRTKSDARAYSVTITPYGREVLEIAGEVARRVDQQLLRRLTPAAGEELQSALRTLSGEDAN